ncbi:DNA-3-methyladenine glycosylase [Metabacillus sp. GX 13764]|uniref:DNA-3-methyladenine glycosylase family protein n=1 Tax=Metabacillus kandeliae TaxID=2900151 RepID=UPI001E4295E6|nr:DNA-3-methyladenine glycosylase [Metabacillus kandeliae]MCD7036339.1 DNA-3-methyladenine glycosylase [Metabacillus kandeliae]
MWEEQIAVVPPYYFEKVLDRLSLDPLSAVDLEEKSIRVPLRDKESAPHVIKVKAVGTAAEPQFEVTGKDPSFKEAAIAEIRRIFQWDVPLADIQQHFSSSMLSKIFEEHEGTPLILDFSLYASLMRCIIHQQLNLAFAQVLTERFVHQFGECVDGVWFFPSPETAAEIEVQQLRDLQFSGRKAEYVIDTSKLIASGEIDLEKMKHESNEEIMKKLIKVRGIGAWTVQNILLFGLGRQNLFPLADVGIQNALKQVYGMEKKPTAEEMEELSKDWHPYLSYASLYLWRSIEKKK